MNGYQIAKELQKQGIKTQVTIGKLPKDIDKHTLVIFIKWLPYRQTTKAIKKQCQIAYDVLDDKRPGLLEIEGQICNGIIYPNKQMSKDYKHLQTTKTKSFVIYHHWDPRLEKVKHKKTPKKFKVAYFGSHPDHNAIHHKKLGVDTYADFKDHLKEAQNYTYLYSGRKKGSMQFLYKPSTKVSTAAALETNIITTKEPSAIELLGKNYPYLTESNPKAIQNMFKHAKKTLGKKEWKKGITTMKKIKKQTSIKNIAKEYKKMIKNLTNTDIPSKKTKKRQKQHQQKNKR